MAAELSRARRALPGADGRSRDPADAPADGGASIAPTQYHTLSPSMDTRDLDDLPTRLASRSRSRDYGRSASKEDDLANLWYALDDDGAVLDDALADDSRGPGSPAAPPPARAPPPSETARAQVARRAAGAAPAVHRPPRADDAAGRVRRLPARAPVARRRLLRGPRGRRRRRRVAAAAPGGRVAEDAGPAQVRRHLRRKARSSAGFRSFRLIFGRAIISRNGLDALMLFLERARAEHSR